MKQIIKEKSKLKISVQLFDNLLKICQMQFQICVQIILIISLNYFIRIHFLDKQFVYRFLFLFFFCNLSQ